MCTYLNLCFWPHLLRHWMWTLALVGENYLNVYLLLILKCFLCKLLHLQCLFDDMITRCWCKNYCNWISLSGNAYFKFPLLKGHSGDVEASIKDYRRQLRLPRECEKYVHEAWAWNNFAFRYVMTKNHKKIIMFELVGCKP